MITDEINKLSPDKANLQALNAVQTGNASKLIASLNAGADPFYKATDPANFSLAHYIVMGYGNSEGPDKWLPWKQSSLTLQVDMFHALLLNVKTHEKRKLLFETLAKGSPTQSGFWNSQYSQHTPISLILHCRLLPLAILALMAGYNFGQSCEYGNAIVWSKLGADLLVRAPLLDSNEGFNPVELALALGHYPVLQTLTRLNKSIFDEVNDCIGAQSDTFPASSSTQLVLFNQQNPLMIYQSVIAKFDLVTYYQAQKLSADQLPPPAKFDFSMIQTCIEQIVTLEKVPLNSQLAQKLYPVAIVTGCNTDTLSQLCSYKTVPDLLSKQYYFPVTLSYIGVPFSLVGLALIGNNAQALDYLLKVMGKVEFLEELNKNIPNLNQPVWHLALSLPNHDLLKQILHWFGEKLTNTYEALQKSNLEDTELIESLLNVLSQQGKNINDIKINDKSLFEHFLKQNQNKSIQILVASPAFNPDIKTSNDETILHLAVNNALSLKTPVANTLVESVIYGYATRRDQTLEATKQFVNIKNKSQKTAIQLVADENNKTHHDNNTILGQCLYRYGAVFDESERQKLKIDFGKCLLEELFASQFKMVNLQKALELLKPMAGNLVSTNHSLNYLMSQVDILLQKNLALEEEKYSSKNPASMQQTLKHQSTQMNA